LTRTIARRLEQLETRAKEVAVAHPEPHTICFISVDNKVEHLRNGHWHVAALRPPTGPCGIRADAVAGADRNYLSIFVHNARQTEVSPPRLSALRREN
jgi:hypothetical protein